DLENLPRMLEGVVTGSGRLGWNLSRVFMTETTAETFFARAPELLRGVELTRDLTNCSPLQLEELDRPLVLASTVKYVHEMAKWTNTGDYGFCASIWGSEEKARSLAEKLHVGRVWINGWMDGDDAFAGWKK